MNNNVYEKAYTLGKNYLDTFKPGPFMPTVMFDIDDTLLYSKNFKGIQPIIRLLVECNKKNMFVLIVTARDSIYTNETIKDLENIGLKQGNNAPFTYNYLYLRKSPKDNNNFFKSGIKKQFYEKGFVTIMSVGDNDIDINGDYSGYCLKLPNLRDPRLFHNPYGKLINVKIP